MDDRLSALALTTTGGLIVDLLSYDARPGLPVPPSVIANSTLTVRGCSGFGGFSDHSLH